MPLSPPHHQHPQPRQSCALPNPALLPVPPVAAPLLKPPTLSCVVKVAKGMGMGDGNIFTPGPVLFPRVERIELMFLVGEAVEKIVLPQFRF